MTYGKPRGSLKGDLAGHAEAVFARLNCIREFEAQNIKAGSAIFDASHHINDDLILKWLVTRFTC